MLTNQIIHKHIEHTLYKMQNKKQNKLASIFLKINPITHVYELGGHQYCRTMMQDEEIHGKRNNK